MINTIILEIANDNVFIGLLEGDEVLVSTVEQPRSNGKDLAVFEAAGEHFISPFTRFGNQIMLLGEHIQVVREHQVKIIGKVVQRSFEERKSSSVCRRCCLEFTLPLVDCNDMFFIVVLIKIKVISIVFKFFINV